MGDSVDVTNKESDMNTADMADEIVWLRRELNAHKALMSDLIDEARSCGADASFDGFVDDHPMASAASDCDALRDVRLENTKIQLDIVTEQRDALRKERDELAAHAARLAAWIKEHGWHSDTCDILDLDEQGCHKSCSCGLGAINDTPETSLARRDARMKSEALEGFVKSQEMLGVTLLCESSILEEAAWYRKQAEGE